MRLFLSGGAAQKMKPKSINAAILFLSLTFLEQLTLAMLFYNQIRREFSLLSWQRGQMYFREGCVGEVTLVEAHQVSGRLKIPRAELELGEEHQAGLTMLRGGISSSNCTCDRHNQEQKHCKHVAALAIWVVERGSLLRLGLGGSDHGLADVKKSPKKLEKIDKISALGVAFVRGLFQNKAFVSLTVEPALRFADPKTRQIRVEPLSSLTKQSQAATWKTSDNCYLHVQHDYIPILQSLTSAKATHQGPAALENLAKLKGEARQDLMAYHENVKVEMDPVPLKLVSLHVGERTGKTRTLTYEFRNQRVRLTSVELTDLSKRGRLSNHFVWQGDSVYRFQISMSRLAQLVNRSGLTQDEDFGEGSESPPDGFGNLSDEAQTPLHPLSVYRLSLELGVDGFTVDSSWGEFHEWKKTFERKKIPSLPDVEFGFDLREYQKNGLSWIWSLHHRGLAALLADDMGLGKTHQVLAYLRSLYGGNSRALSTWGPTLVVAPTSVVSAWVQKLEKYPTGLRWHVFHGKGRVFPDAKVHLVLTTYGILQREEVLRTHEWGVVVLDEAQAIKNAITISSRVSRVLKSRFRIAMTGTPVENYSTDLWSIMEFLLPGYLGSLPRFKRLYGSGRERPSLDQTQTLRRLVSPFLLRRTKDQVLKELPVKTEEMVYCEMTIPQKKMYQAYLNSAEAEKIRENLESSGKVDYVNVLALLTRLKQVCDHPRLPEISSGKIKKLHRVIAEDSGKWAAFEELIHEAIGSNLKVVVFTQYLGVMDLIGRFLKTEGIGFTDLRGDTSDRAGRLKRFEEDAECKVFVCSLLAGGLGIDLTAASVCIHFDRWWNPARESQATDRLHRIGQTRGVQVFRLQIKDTVEDRIARIIESKKALSDALIEESPVGLKAFSRTELLELLSTFR